MRETFDHTRFTTRRHFLRRCNTGIGAIALSSLLGRDASATTAAGGEAAASSPSDPTHLPFGPTDPARPMLARQPMMPARAKRVIYLHMSGSPPQHDLFDYKPVLQKLDRQPCPDEYIKGERFAFIKGHPKCLASPYKFDRVGPQGTWMSELLPNLRTVAGDLTIVRSMWTDQFNHAPAEMTLYTGNMIAGNASMGSWVTWGLGSENQNLPGFVVLVSGGTDPTAGKSVWSSGYLPSVFQGVQCRSKGEPILYADNPPGMTRDTRRRSLDALKALNEVEAKTFGDPETVTRINQFELAYRMQMAVPEVTDLSRESPGTLDAYGCKPGDGTFAANCLLARRMVEQGVRYVQLFDWGWDCHGTGKNDDIVTHLPEKTRQVDRPIAALIKDLKQRGLLDDTLVIFGGEFGRTPLNEERNGSKLLGRDHHPHAFTVCMAGGGVKAGFDYGATDDLGYFVTEDKVKVRDLQASVLYALGLDPHKLHYPYQGLNQRLIGPANDPRVHSALFA
jgi:hypothetical protein